MKLVVAIVHPEDAGALVDALTDKEYRVTRLHSQGGFLKTSNASIIVGVEEAQVEDVIATIRETCHARTQHISPMPPSPATSASSPIFSCALQMVRRDHQPRHDHE